MNHNLMTVTLDLDYNPPGGAAEPGASVVVWVDPVQPKLAQMAVDAGLSPKVESIDIVGSVGGNWDIIVFTVTNATFWTALAAVIRTFITRHRGKKIVLRHGEQGPGHSRMLRRR